MAVPTNTFQTYQAIGNREDLSNDIYNITPYDTPMTTLAKKGSAEAMYTEWQTEALAAVNSGNAVIEGDDATNTALTPTVRVGNYIQTMEKTVGISNIQEAVGKAGPNRERARALINKRRELKRDCEAIILSNQVRVVGTAGTAQKLRPLVGWYATNDSRGAGGADGTASAAATDGTQRNFSETLVRNLLATCYANGAEPSVIMSGPINRTNFTTQISGGATKFYQVADKQMVATITKYVSDYGTLKIMPNRFQRERDMHFIDPDFVELRYLENWSQQDLAVTGLAKRTQMWGSLTLAVLNEAAHGVIADLNTAIL